MSIMFLEELFVQIAVVIVAAAVLSFVANRARQPLMIAYILTGVLIGPNLLHVATDAVFFKTLSDIGVAFLLFMVGLNLDWQKVKEVGWTALIVGVGQVIFTSALGYFVARGLGFELSTALYIAVAFTFSSTIIIVKLLSDKDDLERLYGRLSVGFLIVQDLIAMFLLLVLAALGGGGDWQAIVSTALLKWVCAVIGVMILAKWITPRLMAYAARSQELLFLFGLAWCFGLASLLFLLGFGIETGALLSGVSLASVGYSRELVARMRPLRDFFLIIFFVLLGTQLSFVGAMDMVKPVAIFSLFILIGNPLIVMLILRTLGHHPRTGFMSGTTVAQVSEFSFILLAAGIKLGHIPTSTLTLATLVGLVTITISSYVITYNESIYEFLSPVFRVLEPAADKKPKREAIIKAPEIVLFGFHRMGEVVLPKVRSMKRRFVVVDFDPQMTRLLEARRVPYMYGDAGDSDFLADIHLEKAKLVISTIPDEEVSLHLVHYLKEKRYTGSLIVTAKTPEAAAALYREGVQFVIIPSVLGGERFAELLKKNQFDRKTWHVAGAKGLV